MSRNLEYGPRYYRGIEIGYAFPDIHKENEIAKWY